ncbi:MAG: isoprenyl transferase [Pseudomonadota bacterium]
MPIPEHIAIVMDGNGRWAEQRKRPRSMGHQAGMKAAKDIVRACGEVNLGALTLFAFSSENWRRPEAEVSWLMTLFLRALRKEVDELLENNVRLVFIGDRSPLSPELRQSMAGVEERTAGNTGLNLNIAMNYGGRWDVVQAARRFAEDVRAGRAEPGDLDEARFASYVCLQAAGDPDLLIRTGGEKRVSNFLLWQLAYTECYFSETLWPDFSRDELLRAVDEFGRRQRRFGRISDQVEGSKSA